MKSKMSPMGGSSNHMYRLQPGQMQHHGQDLTPHSAVSSFNLPASYDSSLITPISMTSSPSMPAKPPLALRRDMELNLSPMMVSPTNYQLGWGSEAYSPAYNVAMKPKDRSVSLQNPTVDQVYPASPSYMTAPVPYFGHYAVSAPMTTRPSNSPSSLQQSPHLQSAGGLSSNSSHHSSHGGSMYRQSNQAPILIAPNPQTLRGPVVKQEYNTYGSTSTNPNQSPPRSAGPSQDVFASHQTVLPTRGNKMHKRKHPPASFSDDITSTADCNEAEKLLLQMTTGPDKAQWKDVVKRWNAATGQNLKVAALQMRKKRLVERLRVWTADENRALELSVQDYDRVKMDIKWDYVTENMRKHGGREAWSKDDARKHYGEVHSEEYHQDYEMPARKRSCGSSNDSGMHSPWSESHDNPSQSLDHGEMGNLGSALSPISAHGTRSRENSVSSVQIRMQQQQQQQQQQQHPFQCNQQRHTHQIVYDQQQNNWGSIS